MCGAGLDQDVEALKYYEMSSFAEAKAKGYAMDAVKAPKFVARNRRQLARCVWHRCGWGVAAMLLQDVPGRVPRELVELQPD